MQRMEIHCFWFLVFGFGYLMSGVGVGVGLDSMR